MRRFFEILVGLGVLGLVVFWFLTRPEGLSQRELAGVKSGDVENGELVFWAGGCGSCHAKKGAEGDQKLLLGGGHPLATPFGTFYTPNISPDPVNGIGRWNFEQFANAMVHGVSPEGSHYYPSFPYNSYGRVELQDIADLWAFMKTLPAAANPNKSHELPIQFQLRRGLGLWKLLFVNRDPILKLEGDDDQLNRGRYLVEGLTHCGECHTPRNLIGGMEYHRWLGGAPSPEGKGQVPNITPSDDGIGSWTLQDIEYSLESGFTPSFDTFGGSMVSVQENMAKLSKSDRAAIAVYLKSVNAVESAEQKQ